MGLRGSLGWAEEQGIGTPMAGLAVAQLLLHTLGRCRQGLQDLGNKMGTLRLGLAAKGQRWQHQILGTAQPTGLGPNCISTHKEQSGEWHASIP